MKANTPFSKALRSIALMLTCGAMLGVGFWVSGQDSVNALEGPEPVGSSGLEVPAETGVLLAGEFGHEVGIAGAARMVAESDEADGSQGTARRPLVLHVKDPAGEPLRGARARWRHNSSLGPDANGVLRLTSSWKPIRLTTDRTGRLPVHLYVEKGNELEVTAEGFEARILTLTGDLSGDVSVVLTPMPLAKMVFGRVVDGAGEAVAKAKVQLGNMGPNLLAQVESGPGGWFEYEPGMTAPPYFLTAKSPNDSSLYAEASDLQLGDEHVLVLKERPKVQLTWAGMHSEGARPLDGRVQIRMGERWLPSAGLSWARGKITFRKPAVPFRLLIWRLPRGVASTHGPFEPQHVAGELWLDVPTPTRVLGRVTNGGREVYDALLTVEPNVGKNARGGAWTDREGKYSMEVDGSQETLVVTAVHSVHGRVRSDPINVVAGRDHRIDIEFVAAVPSSLQGTVALPPGLDTSQVLLKYSGVTGLQTLRPDGGFEVHGLAPGLLKVRAVRAQPLPGEPTPGSFVRGARSRGRAPDGVLDREWEVQLRPGATNTLHLDLQLTGKCTLVGSLGARRAKPERLRVSSRIDLYARIEPARGGPAVGQGSIRHDGTFEIEVAEPGSYLLRVDCDMAGGYRLLVETPLDLTVGRQDWEPGWRFGEIHLRPEVRGKSTAFLGEWNLVRSLPGGGELRIELGEDRELGEWQVTDVPEGTYQVADSDWLGGLDAVVVGKSVPGLFPPAYR